MPRSSPSGVEGKTKLCLLRSMAIHISRRQNAPTSRLLKKPRSGVFGNLRKRRDGVCPRPNKDAVRSFPGKDDRKTTRHNLVPCALPLC